MTWSFYTLENTEIKQKNKIMSYCPFQELQIINTLTHLQRIHYNLFALKIPFGSSESTQCKQSYEMCTQGVRVDGSTCV